MAKWDDDYEPYALDLFWGVLLGLLGGALFGILFAPKPGRELQADVQNWMDQLPDTLNTGMVESKKQYGVLMDKTKYRLENHMTQRRQRKDARRLAEAKHREQLETSGYEF